MIPLQRKDSLSVETAHKIARQQSYDSESTLSPITPQEIELKKPEEFKGGVQIKVSVGATLQGANNKTTTATAAAADVEMK